VDSTFIFAAFLDDVGCISLRLDTHAAVIAPLAHRTFDELKQLQLNSYTIVVVATERAGLHEVELPWLGDKKARAAIPYALEEHLAQKLPELHFSYSREYHQQNRYLVAVIDKLYLVTLMAQLDEFGICFNEVTLDWFALQKGEFAFTPTYLMMNTESFRGAIPYVLAQVVKHMLPDLGNGLQFIDTPTEWRQSTTTLTDTPFLLWAAQRLQGVSRINLCQGELEREQGHAHLTRHWFKIAAIFAGAWLLIGLSVNGINLIRLQLQTHQLDKEIAVVYRTFFPSAQSVISPKFRIRQLLNAGGSSEGSTVFWTLLDSLNKAVNLSELTIEQLNYKNKALSVGLKGRDFNVLEQLAKRLKQAHIKVSQTQAASHENEVTAVMELRL
jgi:general secretion pathway protein L